MRRTGAAVALMLAAQTVPLHGFAAATEATPAGPADIAVTVEASHSRIRVGEHVTFTVTATNNGAAPTTGITVAIPLPTSLTVLTSSASVGRYDGAGAAWTVDWIATGHSATLTILAAPTLSGQVAAAVALVGSSPMDGDDLNNVDSVPLVVTPQLDSTQVPADLELSVKAVNDAVEPGDLVTHTVTLSNHGPGNSSTVEVAFPESFASDVVSVTSAPGTSVEGRVWTVGDVAAGGSVTLEETERVERTGAALVNAQIIQAGQPDPDLANNGARAVLRVSSADVLVLSRADIAHLSVGSEVTFTVVATNLGPHEARGVSVIALLPPGLSLVEATTTAGGVDGASGVWQIGVVAPGEIQTLTIRAIAGWSGEPALLTVITSAGPIDPNPRNNSTEAVINVSVSPGQAPAAPGPGSGPGSGLLDNRGDLGWWLTGSGAIGLVLVLAFGTLILARRRVSVPEL